MTEQPGTYNLQVDPDGDIDEVPSIGDILRQLIDERGWPPLLDVMPAIGSHSSTNEDPRHGDA